MVFRCLGSKLGDFTLTREHPEAGSFDDIVFEYSENQTKHLRFLQIKHKQDDLKEISFSDLNTNGDFYLPKYLRSFISIKGNSKFKGVALSEPVAIKSLVF